MALDDAYSKVLLHFNGTNGSTAIVDESGKTWTAHDGAVLATSGPLPKFGSAYLNPNIGGYVSTPDHADFNLGSGDFTVDFWINYYSSGVYNHNYFNQTDDVNNYIQLKYSSYNLTLDVYSGGSLIIHKVEGFGFGQNTWKHIAIVRNGNSWMFFVDGTQIGSPTTNSGTMPDLSSAFIVGAPTDYLLFDEFRLSKGIARWTSNFTPPAVEYGTGGPTGLDYNATPLNGILSAVAESLILDFVATPLEANEALSFGSVTFDFASVPLESVGSMEFAQVFEGRRLAQASGVWPAYTGSGKIESRSALVAGYFPSLSLTAHVLSGEIIEVEGTWPSFEGAGTGHTNEIARVSGNFPGFKVRGKMICGAVAEASGSFPGFIVAASGFQTPLIAVHGSFPAFRISAFGSDRAQILNRQYRATVLNLKTMAVTKYENFNFNSLCFFNGVYLGANEKGIYVLVGDTDDGADIDWSFKTPEIDLLNAVPMDVWLSLRNQQAATLKVWQNEAIEPYSYPVDADTDPLIHMERVKLGRGLNGRVFQMELSGTGPVDLNQIAVVANPGKKSKR